MLATAGLRAIEPRDMPGQSVRLQHVLMIPDGLAHSRRLLQALGEQRMLRSRLQLDSAGD